MLAAGLAMIEPGRPETIRRLVEKGLAIEGGSDADSIPVEQLNASNDEQQDGSQFSDNRE